MFSENDAKMCDMILAEGEIVDYEKGVCDGIDCEWYVVTIDNHVWRMTKHDGAWVYIFYSGSYIRG